MPKKAVKPLVVSLATGGKDGVALYEVITKATGNEPILAWMNPTVFKDLKGSLSKPNGWAIGDLNTLQDHWSKLLKSAIHFLRINDQRERAFLADHKKAEKWKKANKTTWTTSGAKEAEALSVYGFNELEEYFKQFTAFESMLYGAETYYRDHVQHPLRVWLIGLHILNSWACQFGCRVANQAVVKDEKFALPEWHADNDAQELPISAAELGAMWTVAALTHDLGYPLEKVERINDQLERMLQKFGKIDFSRSRFSFQTQHDHLVRLLLQLISSSTATKTVGKKPTEWRTHTRSKYHAKFSKSWELFDHGIVSALILMKSLTFFLESDCSADHQVALSKEDARQFCVRSEILHTMAAHTTPKVYHLSASNLPFLLVLCDELQEWGRPTMSDMRQGRLNGTATSVKIDKCTIDSVEKSDIDCSIEYSETPFKDQLWHAKRVFRTWHERLRPAVDDAKRHMSFSWRLQFDKTPGAWTFTLDNAEPVFHQVTATKPDGSSFDFWSADETK